MIIACFGCSASGGSGGTLPPQPANKRVENRDILREIMSGACHVAIRAEDHGSQAAS
jgi:hypothetical protein